MRVGIIGAGMMGGSLYKGLKGAVLLGEDWIDQIDTIDLLILAIPISAIGEVAEKISASSPKKPLLVLDIGSVKESIAKTFETLTRGCVEFVATHPMAGKEKSGYEHSDSTIFEKTVWVITPHAKNVESSLQKIEKLIRSLGSEPIRMEAAEHDRRAALISQLPYLISKTLLDFVDPESLKMAGPGFKSMVRLASDNPEMRKEISRYNRKNVDHFLKGYIEALKNLIGSES